MENDNNSILRKAAQQILNLQPLPEVQARIAELGRKANEGLLTNDERVEYRNYVELGDLMTSLKLRAKRILKLPPDQGPPS